MFVVCVFMFWGLPQNMFLSISSFSYCLFVCLFVCGLVGVWVGINYGPHVGTKSGWIFVFAPHVGIKYGWISFFVAPFVGIK